MRSIALFALGVVVAITLVLCPLVEALAQVRAAADGCRLQVLGTGKVSAVSDGRSFVLDDGREVRLPGIEVPFPPLPGETGVQADAGNAAKATLSRLIDGNTVELRQGGAGADRYGRILAHAYFMRDGSATSAAHEMLAAGFARVSAHEVVCAAELLAREEAARKAKLGLWAEAYYAIVSGENLPGLMAGKGRFMVVEGRVASVRDSAGTIYINFGRHWSQALTVTILKRHERMFVAAGLEPKKLVNMRVRVRGWLEERNGPRIEASRPDQIEIAER
jgi:endonuclease YncB( thermonuclease family)